MNQPNQTKTLFGVPAAVVMFHGGLVVVRYLHKVSLGEPAYSGT